MAWVRVREKATGKESVKSEGVASMLRDKYEIIETKKYEQPDEAVTSADVEVVFAPNEVAAEKAADADEGVELANARKKYEELYLEKPHGRLALKSLLKLIAEKENAG